jgi:hypothetical protein
MSVLGNAKSNRHRKTHEVESGDASRQSWRLTRGDLPDESRGGVSRGHSSQEARETVWSEGPKDHETDHSNNLCGLANSLPKRTDVATAATIRVGGGTERRWIPAGGDTAGGERGHERMRKQEGAE